MSSENNIFDGMTKWKNTKALVEVMASGKDRRDVKQWIVRNETRSN